jgi:hypothetical protein
MNTVGGLPAMSAPAYLAGSVRSNTAAWLGCLDPQKALIMNSGAGVGGGGDVDGAGVGVGGDVHGVGGAGAVDGVVSS